MPGIVRTKNEKWRAAETAIIICDMWDRHHSINATRRVAELAQPINALANEARRRNVLIIHAPSSCMKAYEGTAARKRARNAPRASNLPKDINKWCSWLSDENQEVYPIDQSDGGVDDDRAEAKAWHAQLKSLGRNPDAPWVRQIDAIEIHDSDVISDSGTEIWNVLEQHGIKNVLLCGVHTNMCVLGRPFGLRQMAKNGMNVALIRDLTDTMYNPNMRPYVSHFAGTDLIIDHIEKFVCPTISSNQVMGVEHPFRFKHDQRKHLVIVSR